MPHNNNNNKLRQILPHSRPSQNNNNIIISMEASPPLKIPRLCSDSPAISLAGLMMWNNMNPAVGAHDASTTDDDQSLPSVSLGLGLTTGGGDDDHHQQQQDEDEGAGKSMLHGFTMPQLQQLQLQSVIYRYIQAGAAVPPSLLVPIWRSLAAAAAVPLHHPTLRRLFPSLKQCNRQMMGVEYYRNGRTVDSESGRCRRTDGKKWRCSKEALPDQKYCDKHMHRGRHRSRNAKQVVIQPPPANSAAGGDKAANSQSSGGSSTCAGSCNIGGKNNISKSHHHCL